MNSLTILAERQRETIAHQQLVSVIIIFLNTEKFLQEAIESVISQTYEQWELLLVDDGSTDGSTALARQYARAYPSKIHYLEHEGHQNRDKPASRNLGIKASKGEYIAFLDADDVWLPHKLERQVEILASNPEATLVYGLDQYWHSWTGDPNDEGRDHIYELGIPSNTLISPPLLVGLFLNGTAAIPCPTNIIVRRSAIESVGGFDEIFRGKFNIYEDQAIYAKLFLKNPVFASNECWDRYRQHSEASCSIAEKNGETAAARIFFLEWLSGYLRSQRVKEPEIWKPLKEELFRYRYPKLYSLLKKLRYRINYLKAQLQWQ